MKAAPALPPSSELGTAHVADGIQNVEVDADVAAF